MQRVTAWCGHILQLFTIATMLVAITFPAFADDLSSALSLKIKYLSQNQAVIAKNLANSNTPNYKALQLSQPKYKAGNGITLATTSSKHISNDNDAGGVFKATKQKDTYETAPNGNNVSVEEQMAKMATNNLQHQEATNLYKKMTGLYNLATGER